MSHELLEDRRTVSAKDLQEVLRALVRLLDQAKYCMRTDNLTYLEATQLVRIYRARGWID